MANLRPQEAVKTAMSLILKNGREMRSSDIFAQMGEVFPQSDYEREPTKSGGLRWWHWLAFYSIDAVKAGFIVKDKGVWHLTSEGEKALNLSLEDFAKELKDGYDKWWYANKGETAPSPAEANGVDEDTAIEDTLELDVVRAQASSSIRNYILKKNPFEFQELVAALLRSMGYYTPFIAPKGRDGGIDIIAYHDPLGATTPQIKVQVKHYPQTAIDVTIVRNLVGVLTKQDEIGLVVTSGTFTNDAKREARNNHRTVRLIDGDEFVSLWIEYFGRMSEADKQLLPIVPVYFLKPDNE